MHAAVAFGHDQQQILSTIRTTRLTESSRDDFRQTALHIAAGCGASLETVEALLQADSDQAKVLNLRDETPLHVAITHDASIDVIRLIVDAYSEASIRLNNLGRTPLRLAVEQRRSMTVIRAILNTQRGKDAMKAEQALETCEHIKRRGTLSKKGHGTGYKDRHFSLVNNAMQYAPALVIFHAVSLVCVQLTGGTYTVVPQVQGRDVCSRSR